jgi:hypothetical protein
MDVVILGQGWKELITNFFFAMQELKHNLQNIHINKLHEKHSVGKGLRVFYKL